MSPRTPLLVLLAALFLAPDASADRRRAVRSPGPQCTFSVQSSIGDPVPETGLARAIVRVTGIPATCTSWAAYPGADWITIETDAQNAYVTITPNPTPQLRSARITVAGVQLQINQIGATIAPPEVNLLQNGAFTSDLSFWGWQDRFPNAVGTATWSSLDAAGSASSGSIRLTDDTGSTQAFQQLQCVQATPGVYQYGFTVRANSTTAVQPVIALIELDSNDCSGPYPAYSAKTFRVATPGAWEQHTYTGTLRDTGRSILIVIGGWARQAGTHEVWIDDVFLRPN